MLTHPYRHYIKRHWTLFLLGLGSLTATNMLDAVGPWLIGLAIDDLTLMRPFAKVFETVGLIVGVALLLALFRFLWRFFWSQFHHSVAEDLRNRVFAKFTEMGPSFFAKKTTGDLMSLVNTDVNTFRMAIGPGILILFDALTLMIFLPVLMWQISPDWLWKCLILTPLVPFVMRWLLKRTEKAFEGQQSRFAEMSGAAQEIVSAVRLIKSYAQEANQTRLFNKFSRRYQLAADEMARASSLFSPILIQAAAFGSVVLLIIGAPAVMSGAVSLGLFFAYYQYVQRMIWPMEALGEFFHHHQMGKAAFHRLRAHLEVPTDIPETGDEKLRQFESLEVKNLSFSYPGTSIPVLRQLSFKLRAGEILGVVGKTGAGKSTLAHILCRLYPLPQNSFFLNSIPVEKFSKDSFRQNLAFSPQDTFLFSRALDENIALGLDPWTEEDIFRAADLVKMSSEVDQMPRKFKAILGEKGVNLSGGQKQRVAMARALIRSSPLVILDDALSAVDVHTEAEILAELQIHLREKKQGAAIIISHRLTSVRWADKILVLNEGQVEALGTHEQLIEISPTYRSLFELQSKTSEVDA